MKDIATKTKLVFLPLVFLTIVFVVGYCFLYWLFCIQFEMIHLKKEIIEFWIPIGLAFILLLLLIRPRLHLLKLDKDGGKIRVLYYLVAAAIMCVSTIISIGYIDSATGKLTKLFTITDLTKKPPTKYYKPSSYVLRKDLIGIQPVSSYSGKHNQYLNFDIYVAVPFIGDLYDTLDSPPAFLSVKYHEQISSKIKNDEREREWDNFWNESFERFEKERISFKYLERYDNTEERDRLINAARKSTLYKEGNPVLVLKPIDEPFNQRTHGKLRNLFLCLGIGFFIWLIMIVIPGLHHNKVKKFDPGDRKEIGKQINEAYEFIRPRPGFAATPIITGINILVFLIMVFAGLGVMDFYTPDLIRLGALYEPLLEKGEWWRLLTSMFLHGGLMHIVMNTISLVLSGIILESSIGTNRFVTGYILSGIVAALVSVWWHDQPIVAVGASGAIFGLYGILLSLIVSKHFDPATSKVFLVLLAFTAGYSLLMGFLSEGIDNSAHVGGLIAGFAMGLFYAKTIKEAVGSSDIRTRVRKSNKDFIEQD